MEQQDFITRIIETISITIDYFQKEIDVYNKNILKTLGTLSSPRKAFNNDFTTQERLLNQLFTDNQSLKEELEAKITAMNAETLKNVEEYTLSLNIQGEVQKTIKHENDHYHGQWLSKKKKRQELNHKINSLERDFNQKIEEFENTKASEGKTYKSKVNEELRKMGIDLQRLATNTTKACNVIEKELLDINDYKGINESKKKIKEIRKNGLIEQENLKVSYYQAIYELSLNYANLKLSIEDEIARITYDYNVKMNALKKERMEMALEEKHENLLHLSEVERKAHSHLSELKNKDIQNRKEIYSALIDEKKEEYQGFADKQTEFVDLLEEISVKSLTFDKTQIDVLNNAIINKETLKSHNDEIRKIFISVIKSCISACISSLESITLNRYNYYNKVINNLIISFKRRKYPLTDNFVYFYGKVKEILSDEIEKENTMLNEVKAKMEAVLKSILMDIDSLFNIIDEYHNKEEVQNSSFVTALNKSLDSSIEEARNFHEEGIRRIENDIKTSFKQMNDEASTKEEEMRKDLALLEQESSEKLKKIQNDIDNTLKENENLRTTFITESENAIIKLKETQKKEHEYNVRENEKEKDNYDSIRKNDIKEAKQETARKKKAL